MRTHPSGIARRTAQTFSASVTLLVSTSGFAQVPADEDQTKADPVCQLSGDCAAAEGTDPPDGTDAPPPVTDDRLSTTRGFKLKLPSPQATPPMSVRNAAGLKLNAANPARGRTLPPGRADIRVSFVSGSAELTDAGKRVATKFAEALRSPPLASTRFRIEGHSDGVGNRGYNVDLSRRRAEAVVAYLVSLGADPSRLEAAGYGFDHPLPGISATSSANRRVEVVRIT